MLFNQRNKKIVKRFWMVISILVIISMVLLYIPSIRQGAKSIQQPANQQKPDNSAVSSQSPIEIKTASSSGNANIQFEPIPVGQ